MAEEFEALRMGSTHKTIYQADAAAIRIPVPPLAEQKSIADFLEGWTAKLDGIIADAQEAIALSKERRATLISAAVTGQIDVGG
jgi:type I restriction enzyme S subunit